MTRFTFLQKDGCFISRAVAGEDLSEALAHNGPDAPAHQGLGCVLPGGATARSLGCSHKHGEDLRLIFALRIRIVR